MRVEVRGVVGVGVARALPVARRVALAVPAPFLRRGRPSGSPRAFQVRAAVRVRSGPRSARALPRAHGGLSRAMRRMPLPAACDGCGLSGVCAFARPASGWSALPSPGVVLGTCSWPQVCPRAAAWPCGSGRPVPAARDGCAASGVRRCSPGLGPERAPVRGCRARRVLVAAGAAFPRAAACRLGPDVPFRLRVMGAPRAVSAIARPALGRSALRFRVSCSWRQGAASA
jgi:hypothetical protein